MRTKRYTILLAFLLFAGVARVEAQEDKIDQEQIASFKHVDITDPISLYSIVKEEARALTFVSQMMVNTDGAPDAYHPDDDGITHLCNGLSIEIDGNCQWKAACMEDYRKAKEEGFKGPTKLCFFAMVTDREGVPLLQGENDPRPGYFISKTAFTQPGISSEKPQAYLDSHEIPYIVIPVNWNRGQGFEGIKLGDFAVVLRKSNRKISYTIVGDLGPNNKLGESSLNVHHALGNDPFMMRYGKRRAMRGVGPDDVVYMIFPGSRRTGEMITKDIIEAEGQKLLQQFGGEEWFVAQFAE
jgi:hypothetical protein